MANLLKETIEYHLRELEKIEMETLVQKRYERFRKIGAFLEETIS
jgi:acetyl-CoA carboxylase alpha subunit